MATTIEDLFMEPESATENTTFLFAINATETTINNEVVRHFLRLNICVRLAMAFLAISTNLLTVAAVAYHDYLKTCTNYFITALAVADIIGGFNCLTLSINFITPMSDNVWTKMCAFEQYLNYLSACSNVLLIFCIAVDRLLFIVFPLRYNMFASPKVALVASISMVILVVGFTASNFCCGLIYDAERLCNGAVFNTRKVYLWTFFFLATGLTCLIHLSIAAIAYQQKKRISREGFADSSGYRITKMLSLVLGVYLACYLPQTLVLNVFGAYRDTTAYILMERITSWFWWVNSWANPLIYAWKDRDFNRAFRSLLRLNKPTVSPATTNSAP